MLLKVVRVLVASQQQFFLSDLEVWTRSLDALDSSPSMIYNLKLRERFEILRVRARSSVALVS